MGRMTSHVAYCGEVSFSGAALSQSLDKIVHRLIDRYNENQYTKPKSANCPHEANRSRVWELLVILPVIRWKL